MTADVDLSRLSQPLLLHLVCLVQLLLQWFNSHLNATTPSSSSSSEAAENLESCQTADPGSFDSIMHRLCSSAVTALSVLMTRYPDTIIEAAQDVHTVRDIISISSRSTGLPFFPTLARVNKMWGFAQARVLETVPFQRDIGGTSRLSKQPKGLKANSVSADLIECTTAAKSVTVELSLATTFTSVSTSIPSTTPPSALSVLQDTSHVDAMASASPSVPVTTTASPAVTHITESLLFDAASRATRKSIAENLSLELKISWRACLLILEYYMGDIGLTRTYFNNPKGDIGMDDVIAEISEVQLELSDENPLRNLGVCYPFGDSKKENFTSPWRSLIPNDITLDRLVVVNAPIAPARKASLSFVESVTGVQLSEKSAAAPPCPASDTESKEVDKGIDVECSELALGACLVRCDEEGPTQFPSKEAIRVCMSEGVIRSHTIVSSFDYDLGIAICEPVETSTLRIVKKYFDRPTNSMPSFIQCLDVSVTILRLREIASKLLEGGNLHLHNDVEKVDDWMKVLRLAVFTASKAATDFADGTDGTDTFKLQYNSTLSRYILFLLFSPSFLSLIYSSDLIGHAF